jgi:uncharacterized protein YcbK (DUF882 family)
MTVSDVFNLGNQKLSNHFHRSEFTCKCGCGFDTVDANLINVLDYIRQDLGHPVSVNSGCRCSTHNIKVGGSPKSQHLLGRAADIKCPDVLWVTLKEVVDKYMDGWGGVGYYENQGFIHIDTRSGAPARWHD